MTKLELANAAHGTETRGHRLKERSVEWSDKADLFQAWRSCGRHYVDIGCGRLHRFLFSEKDFKIIVKAMVSTLPLPAMLEINKFLVNLITRAVKEEQKELEEKNAAKARSQQELRKTRSELWELRRENARLRSGLHAQQH